MADVSVVIPTRNRAAFADRAVASALAQRDLVVQVIVVDDGSTDDTSQRAKRWEAAGVEFVPGPPGGVSDARNRGVSRARAPWVAFLDDDDLWAPDKLASQLSLLRSAPEARWCCTGCVWIDESDRIIGSAAPPTTLGAEQLLARNAVPGGGSTMVVDRELVEALGGFDVGLSLFEDWDAWIRFALAAPGVTLARPSVAFRIWRSTTASAGDRLTPAWEAVAARHSAAAAQRGVEPDRRALVEFEAFRRLRAAQYQAAGDAYRRLDKRYLAVVVEHAGPLWTWLQMQRSRRNVPPAWHSEAMAWLSGAPLGSG